MEARDRSPDSKHLITRLRRVAQALEARDRGRDGALDGPRDRSRDGPRGVACHSKRLMPSRLGSVA